MFACKLMYRKRNNKKSLNSRDFFMKNRVCIIIAIIPLLLVLLSNSVSPMVTATENMQGELVILEPVCGEILNESKVTVKWYYAGYSPTMKNYTKLDSGEWYQVNGNRFVYFSVADGSHTIYVEIREGSTVVAAAHVNIRVDTTPPVARILYPKSNGYVGGTAITARWCATDASGIEHYEISIDNGVWVNTAASTTWTFTGLNEGTHLLRLRACDKAGNVGTTYVTFTVDLTPPVVSITSPRDGAVVSSSKINVSWEGYDALSGAGYYQVRVDGSEWQNVSLKTHYEFDNLKEGNHTITVKMYDVAGNSATASVGITVDKTPPVVNILSPLNNSYLNGSLGAVDVQWWGADNIGIHHYEVNLDRTEWLNVGTSENYLLALPSPGKHTLYVKAVDMGGNAKVSSVTFIVDTKPPVFYIISPAENTIFNSHAVTVRWKGYDNYQIERYLVRVDGGSWEDVGKNTSWSLSLKNGNHYIAIRAVDGAGNTYTDGVKVTVDDEPPDLLIESPEAGEYLNTSYVTVKWEGKDNISGVAYFEVSIDSGEWADVGTATFFNLVALKEGLHTVRVRAYDLAGNMKEVGVQFIIDYTPPELKVVEPDNGTCINVTHLTVSWAGRDLQSGLEYYEIKIDENEWTNVQMATSYSFESLGAGLHLIQIKAVDHAGNIRVVTLSVVVDISPPVLQILTPSSNILNKSAVEISWISSKDAVDFKVRIDNNTWKDVGVNTTYLVKLGEGPHRVFIEAVDRAGNRARMELKLVVDTQKPKIDLKNSYVLHGPARITFEVSDITSCNVTVYGYRNGKWILLHGRALNVNGPGEYKFKVIAVDEAGNRVDKIVTVKVEGNSILLPVILMVIAGVMGALYLIYLKKPEMIPFLKKKKEEEKEEKSEKVEPNEMLLTPKEKAILNEVVNYIKEKEGASRSDVIRTIANRMGVSEEEVGAMIAYATQNYILTEIKGDDGVARLYLLEVEK